MPAGRWLVDLESRLCHACVAFRVKDATLYQQGVYCCLVASTTRQVQWSPAKVVGGIQVRIEFKHHLQELLICVLVLLRCVLKPAYKVQRCESRIRDLPVNRKTLLKRLLYRVELELFDVVRDQQAFFDQVGFFLLHDLL